jgi:hypothetical protein
LDGLDGFGYGFGYGFGDNDDCGFGFSGMRMFFTNGAGGACHAARLSLSLTIFHDKGTGDNDTVVGGTKAPLRARFQARLALTFTRRQDKPAAITRYHFARGMAQAKRLTFDARFSTRFPFTRSGFDEGRAFGNVGNRSPQGIKFIFFLPLEELGIDSGNKLLDHNGHWNREYLD